MIAYKFNYKINFFSKIIVFKFLVWRNSLAMPQANETFTQNSLSLFYVKNDLKADCLFVVKDLFL